MLVAKPRHKNLMDVPSGEVESADVISLTADVLETERDLFGWYDCDLRGTAENWGQIILRAVRYGAPHDNYAGEGWPISERHLDPPMCDDCA